MPGNHRVREPAIPWRPPVCRVHRCPVPLGAPDGNLNKPFWAQAAWIDDFHDIEGDGKPWPAKRTRVKLLWDDRALYVGAQLMDDTIWATVTGRDEVIFVDNDFEVFLAPKDTTHRYYEIEINAANAVWDLLMEKPQRDRVRRISSWDIKGLQSAVHIDGALNDPACRSTSWSVELVIPWLSLRECGVDLCEPAQLAPVPGETWRLNFSRVEYDVHVENGRYCKDTDPATGRPLPEHNWVWAPTGLVDIHLPEMWGYLIFTEHGEAYDLPPDEAVRMALRRLYYRQHAHMREHGAFSTDAHALLGAEAERFGIRTYATPSLFEGIGTQNGRAWHIRQDGYIWEGDDQ